MKGVPRLASLWLLALAVAAAAALALLQAGRSPARGDGKGLPQPESRSGADQRPAELDPAPSAPPPLPAEARLPAESTRAAPPEAGIHPEEAVLLEPRRSAPSAASSLSGALSGPGGAIVSGLGLHWRRAGQVVRSATSDDFGAFQLTGLPRGAGELVLGDPASPVAPPRALELADGRTDLGTIDVPLLGELTIRVLDEQGLAVAEATLSGVGDAGGSIAARSGPDGSAQARFLPRGMFRVFASHPQLGRGNRVFEFEPENQAPIEIQLRRSAPRD